MAGGAIEGIGMEKLLALALSEVSEERLAAGAEGGGGAARVGVAGRAASGGEGGGGAESGSLETMESPVDVKSGGSTYLLRGTFPPKRRMISKWRSAEIVRKRDARIRERIRSK